MHFAEANTVAITRATLNIGNLTQLNEDSSNSTLITLGSRIYYLLTSILDNSIYPIIKLKSRIGASELVTHTIWDLPNKVISIIKFPLDMRNIFCFFDILVIESSLDGCTNISNV